MELIEVQRRFDITAAEVEMYREMFSGTFSVQKGRHFKRGWEFTEEKVRFHNILVNEGLTSILDVYFNAATQITIWYLTGFTANVTPLATHTAAVPGTTELTTTDVAEAVRETFNANAASGNSIDNAAGPVAQYTADQTFTFWGAQLFGGGTSAFGNTAGVLCASELLPSSKAMDALDTIDLTYTFASTDV